VGAGLAARASGDNLHGPTYFLVFMVGRWSKAKACVWELRELAPREKGNMVI
jgi:hypothetical protein